jgi:hypothetical protein
VLDFISQEVFCDINDYKCSLCIHKTHILVYCVKDKIKIQLIKHYEFDNEQELYDFFV